MRVRCVLFCSKIIHVHILSLSCSEAPSNVTVISNVDFNVASLNNNVSLMCSSDGGPNNTYQWMKEGMVLDNETDATLDVIVINASTGGSYICTVINLAGNDYGNVTLYVAPYIVTSPEEHVLSAVGDNVSVTCEADGFPSPDVVWNRMGMDMTRSNTSLLEVTPVMFGDEGVYQCVASFKITGIVFNATDEITLFGKNMSVDSISTVGCSIGFFTKSYMYSI